MENWTKISLLLCVFGFLKEIRPSEPYIYDFLIGPWRNVTDEQVTKEVYPVGTYSNMLLSVLVFLITDISRYKPLIIVLGLSQVATYALLLWTTSLFMLQLVEVFYGMFAAAEVAYYTYIYAKVDGEHYQKVTSHTRAAILAGRSLSGLTSQLLVSMDWMDYRQLNYITFTAVSAGTVWALFLPSVEKSIYFHSEDIRGEPMSKKVTHAFSMMKQHFIDAYSNPHVLKWSVWWALSSCGYIQVEYYMQPLYAVVQNSDEAAYNGAVEAILTILGFLAALLAGYLKFNWREKGEIMLAVISLIQGALIITISQTGYIFLCYSFYILFGVLFHFMVTIASAQIATVIDKDSYGLIFGINTFLALIFNSILTALVATKGIGFSLEARGQFIVYGSYHLMIAIPFIVIGLIKLRVSNKVVSNQNDVNNEVNKE